jgi:hypothetical protein
MLLSQKAPLIRSFRHDSRLVPGELCNCGLAHVQMLGNHRQADPVSEQQDKDTVKF